MQQRDGIEQEGSSEPVGVLVEHGGILLLRGDDANLASELEGALDHVVGDDVELLLLLTLQHEISENSRTILRNQETRRKAGFA